MKTRLLIIIGTLIFVGFTELVFAENLYTFEIDGYDILTNTPDISEIDMDWNSEHLSEFSVNFTEPYTGQFQIQIPKNMPRMMNLDFETALMIDASSLRGENQEGVVNYHIVERDSKLVDDRIIETDSLCHYIIAIDLSEIDYFKVGTGSVTAGRWETVSIENEECNMISSTRSIFPLHGNYVWTLPALKQMESGLSLDEIHCRNPKYVLTERPNGKPACVYYSTSEKLGWKILHADSNLTPIIFEVLKNEKLFDVEYYVKGGVVQDMLYDVDTNVLLVTVDATNKGSLTIHLPRSLIDAKMDYCPPRNDDASDDMFFVLIDGEEVSYDEILTTSEKRTLQIPLVGDISKIEIIGTCYV